VTGWKYWRWSAEAAAGREVGMAPAEGGSKQPRTGQNRAPRGERRRRKTGAGELQAAPASPVVRMGGSRRPVAGSKRQREEAKADEGGGSLARVAEEAGEGKRVWVYFWCDFLYLLDCFLFLANLFLLFFLLLEWLGPHIYS